MPLIQWTMQNLGMGMPKVAGSGGLTLGGTAACRVVKKSYKYVGSGGLALTGAATCRKAANITKIKVKFDIGEHLFDINGHQWVVTEIISQSSRNQYYVTDYRSYKLLDEDDLFYHFTYPDRNCQLADLRRVPVVPVPVPGKRPILDQTGVETRLRRLCDISVTPAPQPTPGRARVLTERHATRSLVRCVIPTRR